MSARCIAGYTATKEKDGVLITRNYAGIDDSRLVKTFAEASQFLTLEYPIPYTLHAVWSLGDFTDALFALLPAEISEKLKSKPRVYYDGVKIYSTNRLLGLTTRSVLKGNFVDELEVNIYQLNRWALPYADAPQSAGELARLGDSVIEGLDELGITPDYLTSPAGVFMGQQDPTQMPTWYNFREDWMDAMDYAKEVMHKEWRSAYQVGWWSEANHYDQNGAYPGIMADLPSTTYCNCWHSKKAEKCNWGLVKGIVDVTAPVSPLVYHTGERYINPIGKWRDTFTTEEINWLYAHKAGTFKLEDGWFFRWFGREKPYADMIRQLYQARGSENEMTANIARRIAQGISGKLDQHNEKDGSKGDFYNPVLAAITRSKCRLKVADFIYSHNALDNLIAVQVDGLLSDAPIDVVGSDALGAWRFDGVDPALVVSTGGIWRPGKKALGISLDEIRQAFEEYPQRKFYQFGNKYVDFDAGDYGGDRAFMQFPKTGGEVMSRVFKSNPLVIAEV